MIYLLVSATPLIVDAVAIYKLNRKIAIITREIFPIWDKPWNAAMLNTRVVRRLSQPRFQSLTAKNWKAVIRNSREIQSSAVQGVRGSFLRCVIAKFPDNGVMRWRRPIFWL